MNAPPQILIVDDERAIVTGLSIRLRSAGYSILAAYEGRQAIALAVEHRPALILLDRQMPGTDGMQVLDELKNGAETSHIPVIMLSGCDRDREAALSHGASTFLTKPYDASDLLNVVHSLLARCAVATESP